MAQINSHKKVRSRHSPEQLEQIINRSRANAGLDIKQSDRTLDSKESTSPRKLTRRVVGTVAALAMGAAATTIGATGAVMASSQNKNPVEALDTIVDAYKYALLRQSMCPKAPTEPESQVLREQISSVVYNRDFLLARSEAISKGLHFANPEKTLETIGVAINAKEATKAISNYTREEFGFETQLRLPATLMQNTYAMENYRNSLQYFALYTSMLPAELIRGSAVSKVLIGNYAEYDGLYQEAGNIVKLDKDAVATPITFVHEVLGHAAHATSCNGFAQRDPAYTQYNQKGFAYTGESGNSSHFDNDITVSSYGSKNNLEDVATLTADYITGTSGHVSVYSGADTLTNKLAVILSRLDDIAPGSAQYLTDTRAYFSEFQYLAENNYPISSDWNG